VRLDVPVEQPERRTRPRLAQDPQVLLLAERLACPLGEVLAEDHRAGADADVDLRLQDVRHLRGEAVRNDAVREMIVIAALRVDDVGVPQSLEDQLPGQAVQFENVDFPPAQAVQSAQVLDEPAVIPGRRDRGRGDEHHSCPRERLADQADERGLEDLVPDTGRRQQHSSHGLESSRARPARRGNLGALLSLTRPNPHVAGKLHVRPLVSDGCPHRGILSSQLSFAPARDLVR
jgi:hypothetical protein